MKTAAAIVLCTLAPLLAQGQTPNLAPLHTRSSLPAAAPLLADMRARQLNVKAQLEIYRRPSPTPLVSVDATRRARLFRSAPLFDPFNLTNIQPRTRWRHAGCLVWEERVVDTPTEQAVPDPPPDPPDTPLISATTPWAPQTVDTLRQYIADRLTFALYFGKRKKLSKKAQRRLVECITAEFQTAFTPLEFFLVPRSVRDAYFQKFADPCSRKLNIGL